MDDVAFVLGSFTKDEAKTLDTLSPSVNDRIISFVRGDMPHDTIKL
jgi:hypothetical protein